MLAVALAAAAAVLLAWGAYRTGRRAGSRAVDELEQVRIELSRRLSELFSLQELAYLLSESIQLDRIVTQVARYVTRFLDAQGALVALTDETDPGVRVLAAEGVLAPLAGTRFVSGAEPVIDRAIGQERLEVLDGTAGTLPAVGGITVPRLAVAPLRTHGVTVGVLAVVNRSGHPFSADDLRLISTVATHAAIVLANARFFDQVRDGKEQWETTFDALADGIAVVDESGRIRRANRALADQLAQPVTSVVGRDLNQALLEGGNGLPALLEAARRGEAPRPLTVQHRHRLLRISADPLRGPHAESWVVTLVEDVTEQKTLETQLIQNEKMVAVGQLVSGIAHELNNPLTSIAGLSEFLLEQSGGSEREREHLRVIQEQAERAGRLVRNLLTFARKERPGEHGPVDLNDLAKRTIMLIEYEVRLRMVQLEHHLEPDLPAVLGDQYELQQVVLNLLTNAVHAAAGNPAGQPRRVRVSTARQDDQVVLRVADSGPGIDPAHLPKLFTPFFTTKDPGSGTGLGLSISFGIAERHGGRLFLETGGEGTVFALSLPARPDARGAEWVGRAVTHRLQATGDEGPPTRRGILVVDEDPAMQRMIRALFSGQHQTVVTPPTAADAVRLLQTGVYDLIIADPRAAVSAGETFADVLLQRWPEQKQRTILVTADVRPETHEWLRRIGCTYLQKPFRINDLRTAAERVWDDEERAPRGSEAPGNGS